MASKAAAIPEEEKWGVASAFAHQRHLITGTIQGTVQFVASECLVAWGFQRVTGMKDQTLYQNAWTHLLSIPLIPGVRAQFDGKDDKTFAAEKETMNVFYQSLRQVPAYMLARYIYQTSHQGIRLPRFDRSLLSGVICKILTRPVMFNLMPYLPETLAEANLMFEGIMEKAKEGGRATDRKAATGSVRRRMAQY